MKSHPSHKEQKCPSGGNGGSQGILNLSSRKSNLNGRIKNQQWLKKNGISLQAFGNAKSMGSYNPHLIKKQKELYRNAKLIKKFKKSVKQQNTENSVIPASVPKIDDTDTGINEDGQQKQIQAVSQEFRKGKKKNKSLQSIREEYEKRREEEEKAKMEREAIAKARQEEKERAIVRRKELREKMFKKTRSGQPVMKFRIQHMLEGIIGNPDQ